MRINDVNVIQNQDEEKKPFESKIHWKNFDTAALQTGCGGNPKNAYFFPFFGCDNTAELKKSKLRCQQRVEISLRPDCVHVSNDGQSRLFERSRCWTKTRQYPAKPSKEL